MKKKNYTMVGFKYTSIYSLEWRCHSLFSAFVALLVFLMSMRNAVDKIA